MVDHFFLLGSTKMEAFGFAEAVSAEMLTVRGPDHSQPLVVLVASVEPATHVVGTLRLMLGGRQIFSIF